jgi:Protein of unknown function (DUF2742)
MTAHTGPPGKDRAPLEVDERGADDVAAGGGSSTLTIPRPADEAREPAQRHLTRDEFARRMLDLGRRDSEIPIYGSDAWEALEDLHPRRFASVVRAAECWRLDGTDEAICARIEQELRDNDQLAAWRLRRLSGDLSAAQDWAEASRRLTWGEIQVRRDYGVVA